METAIFYQSHLNRVSRSFAYCISRLDGDLREWVGLSYLLCRVLDTVEDAPWSNQEAQAISFDRFQSFVQKRPIEADVLVWSNSFPAAIPEGERLLLNDAFRLFQDLHSLPENISNKLKKSILNMYRGMRFFLSKQKENSVLRLKNLGEVNQYCFFVAGLVGELLTDLLLELRPQLNNQKLYVDAHHFGLFLQKINLLKDQAKDEKEGRYLIHSRSEVMASLSQNAEGAIRYLQSLPLAEKGFRLFCAWSLFLGLASLPWIERSRMLALLKIPRFVTERLFHMVEKIIEDNQALLKLFQEMLPDLPTLHATTDSLSLPWISELYEGRLSEMHFSELGMARA